MLRTAGRTSSALRRSVLCRLVYRVSLAVYPVPASSAVCSDAGCECPEQYKVKNKKYISITPHQGLI